MLDRSFDEGLLYGIVLIYRQKPPPHGESGDDRYRILRNHPREKAPYPRLAINQTTANLRPGLDPPRRC